MIRLGIYSVLYRLVLGCVTLSFFSLVNSSVLGSTVVELDIVWSAKVFDRAGTQFVWTGIVFVFPLLAKRG